MQKQDNNNLGVPQGSGYPLYLLVCINATNQKDATTIPHAKPITN